MPQRANQSLWSAAYPRLVAIALGWTYKNEADAEDLAQTALTELAAQSSAPPTDLREAILVRLSPY